MRNTACLLTQTATVLLLTDAPRSPTCTIAINPRQRHTGELPLVVRQQPPDVVDQSRHLVACDRPHHRVGDLRIAVNQPVPKGDDLRQVRNRLGSLREVLQDLIRRLADDPELPFDPRAQQIVVELVLKTLAIDEATDQLRRVLDVPEERVEITQRRTGFPDAPGSVASRTGF